VSSYILDINEIRGDNAMNTATEYRKAAEECRNRSRESWERSDTDGFLSQWASDHTARLYDTRAEILENDGLAEFVGLYDGDRRVKARLISTKYGVCWLVHEDETAIREALGKPFLSRGRERRVGDDEHGCAIYEWRGSKAMNELGLRERKELAPAYAFSGGGGRGLAGCASVRVMVEREGDKWGLDATLVAE
jgi:hypothetical protein